MHHELTDTRVSRPTPACALPPARPPASVADDGRVRIGAGLGLPVTART
jgi:hypothetical protein